MAITKSVPVRLSDAEYRERSQRLAAIDRELAGVGKTKKQAMAEFNSKIATLEAEKDGLLKTVETGEEDRPVTCKEQQNHERGIVEFVREDNGEVVGHRPMTSHEKQLTLKGIEAKDDVPFGMTPEGECIELTAAQRDALRFALEKGESGLSIPIEGKGELFFIAIQGVDIGKKTTRRGRRGAGTEEN